MYFRCEYPCPKCGGPVSESPSCPGYPGKARKADGTYYDTTMVCYPFCGNATEFTCDDRKKCGWWWREENNRATSEWNSEQQKNIEMGPRPDWLDDWILANEPDDEDDDDS